MATRIFDFLLDPQGALDNPRMGQASACSTRADEWDAEAGARFNCITHAQLSLKKESQARTMLVRLVFRNEREPRDADPSTDSIVDLSATRSTK